ncbi:MAG: isoamylase early set domain-containing protein [Chloroflexi bacterium]|nr:isoamylase early set domain-containing protein [Chloroflexota bacterium]
MMLKKKFLKTKCKVTFILPEALMDETINTVHLVGDFNEWDESATPLEEKSKSYQVTVDLDLNKEYQFRYLINGDQWHNDWHADRYVANPFSGDNSVVSTYPED